jgi:hypothetical protein
VAAWISDMLCNLYLAKNYTIANNSRTTEAIKRVRLDSKTLEFEEFFIQI